MQIKRSPLSVVLFLPLLMLLLPGMLLAEEAGKFLFVFGKVYLEVPGKDAVPATKGLSLVEGATIVAEKSGKAQIRLKDGSFIAVRPNTRLVLEEYKYKKNDPDNKSVTSLIKGTFRTISGAIAKENPEKVMVKTPVATIGIRGTDHEPAYIPPNDPSFPPDMKPGLYNKVNAGFVYIESLTGERLPLNPGQVGFIASGTNAPVQLESAPAFYSQPNEAFAEGAEASADDSVSGQPVEEVAGENAEASEQEDSGAVAESQPESESSTDLGEISSSDAVVTSTATNSNSGALQASTGTSPPTVTQTPMVGAVAFIQYDSQAGMGSSDLDYKMIEDAKAADTVRNTVLKNTAGHVVGAIDKDGTQHYLTGAITEVYPVTSDGQMQYGVLKADGLYDGTHNTTYPLDNRYWVWATGPAYVPTSNVVYLNFSSGVAFGGQLNGTWSQLSGLNGYMNVDLNASNITSLNLTAGGTNLWQFNATNLALDPYGQFEAQTVNAGSSLNVMYNNAAAETYGAIAGGITGAGNGAVMTFSAKHATTDPNTVGQGVTGAAIFKP